MTWIKTEPFTRVNDNWITSDSLDAKPRDPERDSEIETMGTYWHFERNNLDVYDSIALDLVTETVYNYPYTCVSEKVFRPIKAMRMFIVLGPAGVLSRLHSYGIQTFGDYIDENYDNIQDPEMRFRLAMNSYQEFCERPLEDVKKWMKQNAKRFESNLVAIQELPNRELERFKNEF